MLTDSFIAQTEYSWVNRQAGRSGQEKARSEALCFERKWRRPAQDTNQPFVVSRWTDLRNTSRYDETVTPSDRYIISIALKSTRLRLTRERQIIFDGVMPVGTLHVSAPSKYLRAQFQAPFDFLHFHISAKCFPPPTSAAEPDPVADLNDLILLRDPFAEQLARALMEDSKASDGMFVRCVGQTLAMHVARHEPTHTKVNALPKWRLKKVEDYITEHFDSSVSLSDLAKVAGLSRMHFAAQFRAATGYRPREYLLQMRVEQAKATLSATETPLAEVALAVGFCTQAHFSTVFKRLTGETPARWRIAKKGEMSTGSKLPTKRLMSESLAG